MIAKSVSIFLWSFVVGIILAYAELLTNAAIQVLAIGLGMLGLVFMLGLCLRVPVRAARVAQFVVAVCLGLSAGGISWMGNIQASQFSALVGSSVNTEGVVTGWPTITASGNQALMIRPDGFTQSLRASLRIPLKVRAGDRVWIRGRIKQPENFSSFNYVSYLQKSNVYAELDKPKIAVIEKHNAPLGTMLWGLRSWVIQTINSKLSPNAASIVLGMIIGYSDEMPKPIGEAFKATGLTHILVASGFNLAIIAGSIGGVGWMLGRRLGDTLSLGVIWMFVMLTGGGGSVFRAGVMATIVLTARSTGRFTSSYHTLLMAVVIMTIINPKQLFYDIGFQLSVAATAGVLEAGKLRTHLQREGWLGDLLWPTVGAIIFTAPIIAFYFGTFSVVAPVANLLVLPLVEIVMLFGALTLLPLISIASAPITEIMVAVILKITTTLASWRYSTVAVESNLLIVIGYYIITFLLRESFYFRSRKGQLKNTVSSDKITKIII
ncbi:ComEC/Rec2 family competence protein [bacterium]|nr:MAG: ComEC/Rec2 family competence protein [bacterium]